MWNEVLFESLLILSAGSLLLGNAFKTCKLNEFRCEDGTCLLSEKLCNGIDDCAPNAEDETGSEQWDCSRLTLGTRDECGDHRKFYKCRFGDCVPRNLVCDGVIDCFGGSDEASDLCKQGTLKPVPGVQQGNVSRPVSRPIAKPSRKPPPPAPAPVPTSLPAQPTTPPRTTTTRRPPTTTHRTTTPPRPRPEVVPATRPTRPSTSHNVIFGPDKNECPINDLETEDGEEVLCRTNKGIVDCKHLEGHAVANGTIVVYRCKAHYAPNQRNGPTTTKRFCQGGKWTKKNPKWFCDAQCGIGGRDIISLIVNGTKSTVGKWPWHVGFYQQNPPGSGNYEYFCGGTLLSSRHVLTAAHCVTKKDTTQKRTDEIMLGFGKYFRSFDKNDVHVRFRKILQIDVNPYYDSLQYGSDIALVWFERLELSDRILPACLPLPQQPDLEPSDFGTLAGWGKYLDNSYPEEMQEARLPVVSSRDCQRAHPSLEALVKSQTFCAGYRNGTSACEGDSGGGLVAAGNSGKWSVYGVVSAGVAKRTGGCDSRYYTVFTKVTQFRDWMSHVLDSKNPQKKKRK